MYGFLIFFFLGYVIEVQLELTPPKMHRKYSITYFSTWKFLGKTNYFQDAYVSFTKFSYWKLLISCTNPLILNWF